MRYKIQRATKLGIRAFRSNPINAYPRKREKHVETSNNVKNNRELESI